MQAEPQDPGVPSGGALDRQTVARLLGREPAGAYKVVVRRRDGLPAVLENAPFLNDGRPMPTRYWLVDPALRDAVSRLEADGGVRRATAAVPPEAVAAAHVAHGAARDRLIPPGYGGPVPSGGVGGTRRGVKCLHAHLAWYLAGGEDPVGRWTAEELEVHRDRFMVDGGVVELVRGPVAAIDCGTNSTRLIVVVPDGTVLVRLMRITRLGAGVDASHRLEAEAVERTLSVLREYRRVMDEAGVVLTRVVATSAVRDAANAEEFMRAAAAITGQQPEVLSGDEESLLSFRGATADLPPDAQTSGSVLVVDIGGGSTELAVGPVPGSEPHGVGDPTSVATRSLDIGCVRVSERFLRHDPPRPDEMVAARGFVREQIVAARDALPPFPPEGTLVGLAGTVSTIASLAGGVTDYDRARIHHAVLDRDEVARWVELLAAEDAASRLRRPGMVAGREDVIVGGALILDVIMEAFARPRCLVSEDDILDGLAQSLLGQTSDGE